MITFAAYSANTPVSHCLLCVHYGL